MYVTELVNVLTKLFADERRTATLLLGAPGVGKTAAVSQAATLAGLDLMTLALPTCEAVDLRGLPQAVDGRTVWASPLPRSGRGVLLLDELTSAPRDVQVAAHHIVWSEQGSDMTLGPGWHVVLTGNRSQDRTVYQAPAAPLRNRLTILSIEASADGWAEWAMVHGIDPNVIGFIRWRPNLLSATELPSDGSFPSPRAWERVSHQLHYLVTADTERELIVGTVGEGAASEFVEYLRTARELPVIQAIVEKPSKAPLPTTSSQTYALVTALAIWSREHKRSIMEYVARLNADFAMRYIIDVRDYVQLAPDPHFVKWVAAHKKIFSSAS